MNPSDKVKRARQHLLPSDRSFRAAELTGVDFSGQYGSDLDFSDARLDSADFTKSTLRECRFDRSSARAALFIGACLEDSSAEGTDFSGANFFESKLSETQFVRAVLRQANFESAQGDGVVFRGADLAGSSLRHAKLFGPDFRGADLTHADFSGASLKGADFRGAILDDVIWEGAVFPGARFDAEISIRSAETDTAGLPPESSVASAVDAVQDLIRNAIADPRLASLGAQLNPDQIDSMPDDPRHLIEFLRREMAARGVDVSEALQPFEQALSAIESANGNDPPEEWKAWIEDLMRNPPPAIASIVSQLKNPASDKKP
jgi:uncharacterized protein YjbI with pentapeptide repeats